MNIDKEQKLAKLTSKLSELCEKIGKDYERISKLKSSKEDIIKEIDELLFSYEKGKSCESN